jgi:KRAB domain-containing zinc finger protein
MKTHRKDHPYMCNICNKRYRRKYELCGHKEVHSGSKILMYNICDIYDICETLEQAHSNIHTGNKSHQSYMCGKAFLYKSNLWKHQQSSHPNKDANCF